MVLGFLEWWQDVHWDAVSHSPLFNTVPEGLITDWTDSLAMAEMTTLVSAVYRKYTTATSGEFSTVSPGITGRYEVFYDEGCSGMRVCSVFYVQYTRTHLR